MIAVSNLAKSYGPQTLFREASFQLTPGNRYGLVGANGSGKSTLLRVLAGEEAAGEGTVSIPKRVRTGMVRQDHFSYEKSAILDVVLMGDPELWQAMAAKERLLERADQGFDADRYAELEEIILQNDGYSREARAAEILEGLGIPADVHRRPLSTLSGGFKLRVLLAQALGAAPDLLLLDEPTNHLDILSIRWLEKFLQGFSGVAVVVSHDHRFLDNVCTHILDVDYETVTLYAGNFTDFEQAKREQRLRKEKEIRKREKEIAHHEAFVERFRAKATKARQAQSKLRLIEKKAEGLEPLPQSSRRYPRFRIHQRRPSGKDVLSLEGIDKSYGDNKVLSDVSLVLRRGERMAVIGPNGIGKSTLLKIAFGSLQPDRGEVDWGHETYPGYFPQDPRELLQEERRTVEDWLWEACSGEPIGFVRQQLGQVLFSKEESQKRLGSLSGGEASRLVFARLAVENPNVLLLDEPTNHLDLEAIESLVVGLRGFEGTLLMVSHDRWFVSQLADRILEITSSGLRDYRGTYEEYVASCGDDHLDSDSVVLRVRRERKQGSKKEAPRRSSASERKRLQKLEARRDEVTREIEQAEARIHDINETFCDPSYFQRTPPDKVRQLEEEQKRLTLRVQELMSEWEGLEEELGD